MMAIFVIEKKKKIGSMDSFLYYAIIYYNVVCQPVGKNSLRTEFKLALLSFFTHNFAVKKISSYKFSLVELVIHLNLV